MLGLHISDDGVHVPSLHVARHDGQLPISPSECGLRELQLNVPGDEVNLSEGPIPKTANPYALGSMLLHATFE